MDCRSNLIQLVVEACCSKLRLEICASEEAGEGSGRVGEGAFAEAATANVVTFCISFGSGPTSVTPLTGMISLIWCTHIAASPFATATQTKSGLAPSMDLALIGSAMPSLSITEAKWMPLAPPFAGSG